MHIVICDDDTEFAESLKTLTEEEFGRLEVRPLISIFKHGADFLEESPECDAVFLDIDMPEIDGFEIASKINGAGDPLVVFVTSHDELVYSSIKFRPFRFIRKTHLEDELPEVINSLNKAISKRLMGKRFKLYTKTADVFLDIKDISYIEVFGHWLHVYHGEGEPLECYGSLLALEEQLAELDFVRVHKSYLVNCRYIYAIERRSIILEDGTEIPMSRYKADTVRKKLKNYIRSEL